MTVNATQKNILDPFTQETLHCLREMVGTESEPGDAFEDELESFRFKGYAVAADVKGKGQGSILIHFYPETALKIGNDLLKKMSGGDVEPKGEIDSDIEDALAEWGNTVIGLATRAIETSYDPDVHFEPPYFVRNTQDMDHLLENVQEIITIPVHTEQAGRFFFNYLLHNKTGA